MKGRSAKGLERPRERPWTARGFFCSEPARESTMDPQTLEERYRELQAYVGWTARDAARVASARPIVAPSLPALIDDFYAEIERHPKARQTITGGAEQIKRLKGTLLAWICELFEGRYDGDYVARRWRVGFRHVEIGLDQVYTNVALSRLRTGLHSSLREGWRDEPPLLIETIRSLDKLLDLDLAIIEDAYQSEYMARLQRTERLATLGQVAGGVAHELRNPLNVVKTSVYYLRNARGPSPAKQEEHMKRIERNVELADGVISALSNFARLPTPTLQPHALEPIIQQALENNPPGPGVVTTVVCPPEIPEVECDQMQIGIVVGNLIRNALDAMPGGGELTITARRDDDRVLLAVADQGVGIESENLARIMEPLFSTKTRGLGLGLSIARSIVEKNRGSIQVESELGKGSVFTLRLTAHVKENRSS